MNSSGVPSDTSSSFAQWLSNNLENFSEWSTVVLIKPIDSPTIEVRVNDKLIQSGTNWFNTNYIIIKGSMHFGNNSSEIF